MRKLRSIPTPPDNTNVHTYAHARAVLRDHQSQAPIVLRPQTLRWPSSVPSEFLSAPFTYGSPYGPPVRNFDDLIALQFLQQHHPESLRLRTSEVLSRVNDEEFERSEAERLKRIEDKKKKPKREKRSLVECLKARYPDVNSSIPSTSSSIVRSDHSSECESLNPSKSNASWKPIRSKTVRKQHLLPAVHIPSFSQIALEECQELTVEDADEHLPVLVAVPITYVECTLPPLQYATEIILPSAQNAMVVSPNVVEIESEHRDESTTLSSVVSDGKFGLYSVSARPRLWTKIWKSCSLVVSRRAKVKDWSRPILWNFKKRRRKCVVARD